MQLNTIFDNALACHRAGQLDQAADLYQQILAVDGDHAQASNNLGAILMSHGQFKEAVCCFQTALKVDADLFEAYLNLAKAHKKLGHYSEATNCLSRALALKPDYLPAYLDLSFLCCQQGNTISAISISNSGRQSTSSKGASPARRPPRRVAPAILDLQFSIFNLQFLSAG